MSTTRKERLEAKRARLTQKLADQPKHPKAAAWKRGLDEIADSLKNELRCGGRGPAPGVAVDVPAGELGIEGK